MARDFDGTSDTLTTATNANPLGGSLSVAFWINLDTNVVNGGSGDYVFNLNADSGSSHGGFHILQLAGIEDVLRVNFVNALGNITPAADGFHDFPPIGTGAWKHVVIQYDESVPKITIYVNNSTTDFETTASTRPASDGAVTFGGTTSIDGRLAEFALFNRVLTEPERNGLNDGFSPAFYRPSLYFPLIGTSPETNWYGPSATITSGTAVANHPRIIYPSRPVTGGATSSNIFLTSTFAMEAGFQADHTGVIEAAATMAVSLSILGTDTFPPYDKPLQITSIDVFPTLHISDLEIE